MQSLAQGDELKNSIRSICKHVKFDFDIVLLGDSPKWYNGLHIPTDQVRGMRFAKCFDITNKLLHLFESDIVEDEFIYMYDDIYMISDVSMDDFRKIVAMEKYEPGRKVKGASANWQALFDNTFGELSLPLMYNYETHLPRLLKKSWLRLIVKSYNLYKKPMLFNTLYFNEFYDKPDVVLTELNEIKAGVYKVMTTDQIEKLCTGKKFLNHSENTYNDKMVRFLNDRFKEKSKFEV